jgi:hypothetical protein
MSQPGGAGPPFQVVSSDLTTAATRALLHRAAQAGQGARALAAYLGLLDALERRARDFGEPLYPLTHMRLQVRAGSIRPLLVNYAVHEDQALVFIRFFALMSDPGP